MSRFRKVWYIMRYFPILEALEVTGCLSTAAKISGYSQRTVHNVVKEFEKLGLVKKEGTVVLTDKGQYALRKLRILKKIVYLPPKARSEVRKR